MKLWNWFLPLQYAFHFVWTSSVLAYYVHLIPSPFRISTFLTWQMASAQPLASANLGARGWV